MAESSENSTVFVAKLPKHAKQDELKELFAKYGEIKDVKLKTGYAFIVKDVIRFLNNQETQMML